MILAKVPIAEGIVAVAIIIGLQYLLAKIARESPMMERLINSRPTLLFYDGRFLDEALSKEMVTQEEVYAAVRNFRIENMRDVKAVVMELNGELTVVKNTLGTECTSLHDIKTPGTIPAA